MIDKRQPSDLLCLQEDGLGIAVVVPQPYAPNKKAARIIIDQVNKRWREIWADVLGDNPDSQAEQETENVDSNG